MQTRSRRERTPSAPQPAQRTTRRTRSSAEPTSSPPAKRTRGRPPKQEAIDEAPAEDEDEDDGESTGNEADDDDDRGPRRSTAEGSRRGAPRPQDGDDSDFEAPVPQQDGDEDDGGEYHPAEHEQEESDEQSEQEQSQQEDPAAAARREVMRMSLPDLQHSADGLVAQLRAGADEPRSAVHEQLLSMKRRAFTNVRLAYEDPPGRAYIDYRWLSGNHTQSSAEAQADEHRALLTLGSANLASALDVLDALRSDAEPAPLDRLAELDGLMADLFRPFGPGANDLVLALDLRTVFAIEALAAAEKAAASGRSSTKMSLKLANPVLASVWCERVPPGTDYPVLFSGGDHLRPLAHRPGDLVEDAACTRIMRMCDIIRAGRHAAVANLRARFPMPDVLGRLWSWILDVYAHGARLAAGPVDDEFHDAIETRTARHSLEPSLEPIQRASSPPKPSYFNGVSSLAALRRRRAPVPALPRPSPPAQSQDDEYHDPPAIPGEEEEDDEDDGFQQDRRPPPPPSQVAQQRRAREQILASRPPPPPMTGAEAAAAARAAAAMGGRRTAWTPRDTETLTRLVDSRQGMWSVMEREDQDKFENPRGQQAYRDKARNIKVALLLADQRLPRGFDRVVLGKKENDHVRRAGRNPWRLEVDYDERGVPTNTVLTD